MRPPLFGVTVPLGAEPLSGVMWLLGVVVVVLGEPLLGVVVSPGWVVLRRLSLGVVVFGDVPLVVSWLFCVLDFLCLRCFEVCVVPVVFGAEALLSVPDPLCEPVPGLLPEVCAKPSVATVLSAKMDAMRQMFMVFLCWDRMWPQRTHRCPRDAMERVALRGCWR